MTEHNQPGGSQSFDDVHGTQFIYRQLLDAMARPGEIRSISEPIQSLPTPPSLSTGICGLAITLLDREVSFMVHTAQPEPITQYIHWRTFSRPVPIAEADYVFIDQRIKEEEISLLMQQVKIGTLTDPHLSATLILLTEEIGSSERADHTPLSLKGPGIKTQKRIWLKGISPRWWSELATVNQEYPLGVDMILVSQQADIVAIPRTTTIERG